MYGDQERIRCVFMRGGTSRGAFLLENDLPRDPLIRDQVILAIYGSPDPRQINGIGGRDSLTSKVAIVGPSSRPDADVDYTFGQVRVNEPVIDYTGACGNMAAGIGPFAIDEGLVRAVEPVTQVRIYHTNIDTVITAQVPVRDGRAVVMGDCAIDGVPGTGARIMLDFGDCSGSVTGKLLPTGHPRDQVQVDGLSLTVSLVDAANPAIFVRARDVGLKGTETPAQINNNREILDILEKIRSLAAEMLGFVADRRDATRLSPAIPKIAFVSPPQDYTSTDGRAISRHQVNLVSRIMSMQTAHSAYAVTGGICTAVAARLPGTVVNDVFISGELESLVSLGHPAGFITFDISLEPDGKGYQLKRAAIQRTARRIMDGFAYVPKDRFLASV
ncbi:MAG: 3-methylitaconate isomerase [Chloroflexi bacterium]|nr:3-methylitaconate isomerase [Chloroflexota bacterium]